MEHETFWTLVRDPNHWLFEMLLMGIFDGLIGALLWPRFQKWRHHHNSDDRKIDDLQRQISEIQAIMGLSVRGQHERKGVPRTSQDHDAHG